MCACLGGWLATVWVGKVGLNGSAPTTAPHLHAAAGRARASGGSSSPRAGDPPPRCDGARPTARPASLAPPMPNADVVAAASPSLYGGAWRRARAFARQDSHPAAACVTSASRHRPLHQGSAAAAAVAARAAHGGAPRLASGAAPPRATAVRSSADSRRRPRSSRVAAGRLRSAACSRAAAPARTRARPDCCRRSGSRRVEAARVRRRRDARAAQRHRAGERTRVPAAEVHDLGLRVGGQLSAREHAGLVGDARRRARRHASVERTRVPSAARASAVRSRPPRSSRRTRRVAGSSPRPTPRPASPWPFFVASSAPTYGKRSMAAASSSAGIKPSCLPVQAASRASTQAGPRAVADAAVKSRDTAAAAAIAPHRLPSARAKAIMVHLLGARRRRARARRAAAPPPLLERRPLAARRAPSTCARSGEADGRCAVMEYRAARRRRYAARQKGAAAPFEAAWRRACARLAPRPQRSYSPSKSSVARRSDAPPTRIGVRRCSPFRRLVVAGFARARVGGAQRRTRRSRSAAAVGVLLLLYVAQARRWPRPSGGATEERSPRHDVFPRRVLGVPTPPVPKCSRRARASAVKLPAKAVSALSSCPPSSSEPKEQPRSCTALRRRPPTSLTMLLRARAFGAPHCHRSRARRPRRDRRSSPRHPISRGTFLQPRGAAKLRRRSAEEAAPRRRRPRR